MSGTERRLPSSTYRAAAIQFNPLLGDPEGNVHRLLGLAEEAAEAGARLIVLPEMANIGYCFLNREEVAPFLQSVPGPLTERLTGLATRHECVIVCGLGEIDEDSGLCYNTVAVIGPGGYLGKYRKTHFFSSDAKWAVEGDLGFPVWDTPAGRIGVEVCMDALYPEAGRLLALQGAQVICFPTNWVGSTAPDHRWMSQAFENGAYWIAADRSDAERGLQFMGGSCIVDPDGHVQALAPSGEAIVYGEIDLARTEERRLDGVGPEDKLADRRPELYREMLRAPYAWLPAYYHTLYGAPGLPAPRSSRVGVLQRPPGADARSTVAEIGAALAAEQVDLLVLPELALTGPPGARNGDVPEGLGGIDELADLAGARSAMIATSVVERAGEALYNTAVLVGPDGLVASSRKRHLGHEDRGWATPGDEPFATVDTPVGRIGLAAGYDAAFFETLRVLATGGADIVAVPAALRAPRASVIGDTGRVWSYWRSKAWESCVVLALANYPGPEYAGGSGIWMPDVREDRSRESVAGVEGSAFLTAGIDTGSRYIREKRGMGWRRLHLYTPLVRRGETTPAAATAR